MSVPGNINTAPPPSSFDDDPEFFEENRWKKFKRRLIEEPLIPLGCAATCWALFEAGRSIRSGDKEKTNRMFRRRIYAQGFTLVAVYVGSLYWDSDRKRRKEYTGLVKEKKDKERHEKWIRELEIRDEEEQELRKIKDKIRRGQASQRDKLMTKGEEGAKVAAEAGEKAKEKVKEVKDTIVDKVKSTMEDGDAEGPITRAVRHLWTQSR